MNFNIFSPNGEKETEAAEKEQESSEPQSGRSYYEGQYTYKKYGFLQSSNHGADPIASKVELKKVMEGFRDRIRKDGIEQEKMKVPIRKNIDAWKIELERSERDIKRMVEVDIPEVKKEIRDKKAEITDIRKNPGQYQQEKPNRISFYFGIAVLVFLTVYLWIFYTSASYSAFFRQFNVDDINVANSMFDAKAISKAYNDGIPAFVLVVSMPFIFLALGYLIHKFNESKNWTKYLTLGGLFLVTFGFDYIIAYEIVKKVYDLKALNSLGDVPEYNFRMAFSDINFWLIIFAGFVTYLIWGFLFDKLMHTHELFDVVKVQVRIRQEEIAELTQELKKKEEELKRLENEKARLEAEIKKANQDLEATFFKSKDFEHVVYQFSSGWMQYIEGGKIMTEEKKTALRQETKQVIDAFIQEHNNGVFYEQA